MTAPKCRCTHPRDVHGLDRKRRPTCFGNAMCGCSQFGEPDPIAAAMDRHPSGKATTDGGPSVLEYLKSKGEA